MNTKTIILVGTVLEVEIGTKTTALGRRRTFVVAKFYLGGGKIKVATINIRIVKLHTPEHLCTANNGYGGERNAVATTTTIGDTNITDLVSDQVFEAPAPYPLNDEAFRVMVAQPMGETHSQTLSTLAEAGGLVVGTVLSHVEDASTVDMTPYHPIP